jgi:HD-GYP domain-containing protein (c-di-GMP phosphodiesterase class II)
LRGRSIPLEARVLAVADAFDAMTSPRPYRNPLTTDRALAEVEICAGSQFDPAVAEAFLQVWVEHTAEWPAAVAS